MALTAPESKSFAAFRNCMWQICTFYEIRIEDREEKSGVIMKHKIPVCLLQPYGGDAREEACNYYQVRKE